VLVPTMVSFAFLPSVALTDQSMFLLVKRSVFLGSSLLSFLWPPFLLSSQASLLHLLGMMIHCQTLLLYGLVLRCRRTAGRQMFSYVHVLAVCSTTTDLSNALCHDPRFGGCPDALWVMTNTFSPPGVDSLPRPPRMHAASTFFAWHPDCRGDSNTKDVDTPRVEIAHPLAVTGLQPRGTRRTTAF